MSDETLGQMIRRRRLEAGYTLRGFAELIAISPAYQSDIELGRRVPTDDVLQRTAKVLRRRVEVTYEELRDLSARIEPDLHELVRQTPEVSQLLRQVQQTGRPAGEVIRQLQDQLRRLQGDGEK